MSVEQVAEALGATVISETPADAPSTPKPDVPPPAATEKPTAPKGPSGCADCGTDLAAEWADPTRRDYIRLSFVKFRKYLCGSCYTAAIK
jgi:hypothetical protein